MEKTMRPLVLIALVAPLALGACGGTTEKTVIVTPPANSTTTVDDNGHAHTTPNN
jgi:predicted small lipoprotein YifL